MHVEIKQQRRAFNKIFEVGWVAFVGNSWTKGTLIFERREYGVPDYPYMWCGYFLLRGVNERAPRAINCPARFPYSVGHEAILSLKGNNVATTPLKALDAFFLFLRNMRASTL
jgi:hypothetical protein